MKKTIYINGRFLTQTITGVQRYAIEVVKSWDSLISQGIIDSTKFRLVLLTPKNTRHILHLKFIEQRAIGILNGHLWEQFELPFFSLGSLLVSFCNTAPLLKKNQFLTIHDAATSANKQNYSLVFRSWYRILHRILPFRTRKIITDSQFSKKELMRYYSIEENHIEVSYLGVEHILHVKENLDIIVRNQLNESSYVLAVSSINPNKNFRLIAEALKYIKVDIKVVIVGDQNNLIYNEIENLNSDQLKMVGYVTDNELKALYKYATVFVFPSIYEGFGLPPLEAMACGCPVISSNSASMPEVLQDAAIYCSPYDAQQLAEKIEETIESPLAIQQLRQKGYIQASKYTWERCAKEIFQKIEEVTKY